MERIATRSKTRATKKALLPALALILAAAIAVFFYVSPWHPTAKASRRGRPQRPLWRFPSTGGSG